jgi:glutamyl-tRNA reductase
MALMALGINYQTASVDIRSTLFFDFPMAKAFASRLINEGWASEAVVISTCNRTELYCEAEDSCQLLQFLIGHSSLAAEVIQPYTYVHLGNAAATHLMRVTTGLDSMILGEGEILGQVKEAFMAAQTAGTVGKHLDRLFQTAFSVAKEARSSTGIGVNPVSVAYAAAKLSQHIFTDLADTSVLLIGAGDLIRLTAIHLKELGVKKIRVANRSKDSAKSLALQIGGESFDLEEIPVLLPDADMVIAGTACTLPIIRKGMVQEALKQRKRKPVFMVDLSVPRNIECEIREWEDVYLYCIDDLQNIVEENRNFRLNAAKEAESIIEQGALQFMNWLEAQDSFKILCGFRKKFENMSEQLLQEGLRHIQLGENPETVLKRLAYRLTNRFLHTPTRRLRAAGLKQEEALLTLTRDLFELNHETFYTK